LKNPDHPAQFLGFIGRQYDQGGGAELSFKLLVESFAARGHRIAILAQSWNGPIPPGAVFHPIPAAGRARALRTFAAKAAETGRRLGLDICLTLTRVPGIPFFRAGDGCHLAWLKHRAPYESWLKRRSFHLNPLHRAQLELEAETVSSPDLRLIIANSRMVAEELKFHYGLPESKIKVIYNPVSSGQMTNQSQLQARAEIGRELGLDSKQPIILFLGSGFERKGLAFMIKALPALPLVTLLVAGRGKSAFYERLAAKCAVREKVKFLGLRPDPARLLAAADILALPTIYDPCANVCLEALAAGKPVVTTCNNGAKEMISQGENGFVIKNPADSQSLAHACQQALNLSGPVSAPLNNIRQWFEEMSLALGVGEPPPAD
jgi:UDP-glucose:(heptosyl)LPS alpha-1,3-glucosyltransferase